MFRSPKGVELWITPLKNKQQPLSCFLHSSPSQGSKDKGIKNKAVPGQYSKRQSWQPFLQTLFGFLILSALGLQVPSHFRSRNKAQRTSNSFLVETTYSIYRLHIYFCPFSWLQVISHLWQLHRGWVRKKKKRWENSDQFGWLLLHTVQVRRLSWKRVSSPLPFHFTETILPAFVRIFISLPFPPIPIFLNCPERIDLLFPVSVLLSPPRWSYKPERN